VSSSHTMAVWPLHAVRGRRRLPYGQRTRRNPEWRQVSTVTAPVRVGRVDENTSLVEVAKRHAHSVRPPNPPELSQSRFVYSVPLNAFRRARGEAGLHGVNGVERLFVGTWAVAVQSRSAPLRGDDRHDSH